MEAFFLGGCCECNDPMTKKELDAHLLRYSYGPRSDLLHRATLKWLKHYHDFNKLKSVKEENIYLKDNITVMFSESFIISQKRNICQDDYFITSRKSMKKKISIKQCLFWYNEFISFTAFMCN